MLCREQLRGREGSELHISRSSTHNSLKCRSSDKTVINIRVKMPETAEEFSRNLTTNRNCTVEITNLTKSLCLINPKVYMKSGYSFNPPQPTVCPSKTEVCSFSKAEDGAKGCVGVLTYEVHDLPKNHSNEIVAIMFSVPFDYNFYSNWLGIGVFELARECNEDLYDHMYNDKDMVNFARDKCCGSGVKYLGRVLELRATMSDGGRAMLKLEVFDRTT
ncbi:hypothetical protein GJAV_G00150750 [Gymnothorax javanicus]|nr:hypothetical protein GJAV_G00150750 [Gymnothorax javanicus]